MRPFLIGAATALLLISCSGKTTLTQEACLDFLYGSMSFPDSLVHPREYWEANVAKTLEVRERMGWDIPEREFLHFVLPLRVNNENLDNFRTNYADTLCRRVEGMSLADAALEINHWCHEQATYRPSDARTLGPEATMRCGLGRCGEESVLTVAALRAAGIPARQVYTPRWAHTDDNHAWVEVWVDGKWHFMGACEPESVLDLAWFNAPVSRAMLLHTKVYGKDYNSGEDIIRRTDVYTEINCIGGYIPTRRNTVRVVDEQGLPVEGASVQFKIYNYAEFYPVATYKTDSDGLASLDTGCGDLFVWAEKDGALGFGVVSGPQATVVLDRRIGESFASDLDIVPPAENPLPDNSTVEQKALNARRLAYEDSLRLSKSHPLASDPGIFLSDKDLVDIKPEVIEDALYEQSSSDRYVVSPRIELEMLLPVRREIRSSDLRLGSASEVMDWVRDSIRIVSDRNPQGLRIPPAAVWRSRLSDAKSRDIFYVALCRAMDIPARINSVTGIAEYREKGLWHEVRFDSPSEVSVPQTGTLRLSYRPEAIRVPEYYRHFTLSRIGDDGLCHLLEYDEGSTALEYALPGGNYLLTSGMRLADGSVKARLQTFTIHAGEDCCLELVLRSTEDAPGVIGSMDAERKFLPEGSSQPVSLLSRTGRGYFLVVIGGQMDEPSVHARRQLGSIAGELNAWGRPVVLLGGIRPEGLENAIWGQDSDGVAAMLRKACNSSSDRLPLVAMCDSFGRIIYYSEGYNTSLAENLKNLLHAIR